MAESKKIEDVGAVLKKVSDLNFKGGWGNYFFFYVVLCIVFPFFACTRYSKIIANSSFWINSSSNDFKILCILYLCFLLSQKFKGKIKILTLFFTFPFIPHFFHFLYAHSV